VGNSKNGRCELELRKERGNSLYELLIGGSFDMLNKGINPISTNEVEK